MGEVRGESGLPIPPSSLIGRQADVERMQAVLDSGARLVTLTGPGGVGKTRLALEVTRLAAGSYAHGVAFISLEALERAGQVFPRLMNELGIGESPNSTPLDDLRAALAEKHMLLCIDNWEQVIEAAGDLARLLGSCPRVQVIATSREALRIRGEQEYLLQPLGLGDGTGMSLAAQLFLERAKLARLNLVVDDQTAAAASEICRLLDGLPLAIELAAALLRVFSPEALLARLRQSPGLSSSPAAMQVLTGGARDLPDRHRTLRSTIAWSYQLLNDAQQQLFRRLAVFVGGCDLKAAQAVCGGPPGEGCEVFEHLLSLADKHLIESDMSGSEPRFRMLRTIQEYAFERLDQAGELEQARARHTCHYLDLVDRAEDQLFGPKRGEWLNLLKMEHDNLSQMMEWVIQNRQVEDAYRASGTLWRSWVAMGHGSEGRRWFERVLALPGEVPVQIRANAINGAGSLAFQHGDFDQAKEYWSEALRLRTIANDRPGMAASNHNLGQLAIRQSDFNSALVYVQASLALDREAGDQAGMASGHYSLAMIYNALTQPEAAQEQVMLGMVISQSAGDRWQIGLAHDLLGSTTYALKRYDESADHFTKAKALFEELGDLERIPLIDVSLGLISLHRGNLTEADTCLAVALNKLHETGDLWCMAAAFAARAYLAAAQGNSVQAVRLCGVVENLRKQIGTLAHDHDRADSDEFIGPVRVRLKQKDFEAEMAAGMRMSLEEAVAYAMAAGASHRPAPAVPGAAARKTLPAGLTAREAETLWWVADGLTDQEVAEKLVISPRTVNAHLTSIYSKLGVGSRAAATRFALKNGLAG